MKLDEINHRLSRLDTACLCDANKTIRTLDPGIRPIRSDLKLIGRARTVVCQDDFLTVLLALEEAKPGEVLVVDGRGGRCALAGELFASEAARKGLGGLVVDGAVRDIVTLHKLPVPPRQAFQRLDPHVLRPVDARYGAQHHQPDHAVAHRLLGPAEPGVEKIAPANLRQVERRDGDHQQACECLGGPCQHPGRSAGCSAHLRLPRLTAAPAAAAPYS